MLVSFLILIFSSALFFFYLQTLCERVLRREFSHPYFQEIIKAIQLEYPRLSQAVESKASLDYSDARLALECDFMALTCLLKNGDRNHRRSSRHERLMFLYFRFQLFSMSIRHALKLPEGEAVVRSAAVLQYFANLVGERLNVTNLDAALANPES